MPEKSQHKTKINLTEKLTLDLVKVWKILTIYLLSKRYK